MTYFGFLLTFVCLPVLVLAFVTLRQRSEVPNPRMVVMAIALHIVLALVYTTPWDNYLVATGVWYYDPKLVTGLVLGWVPIEEYTFFVMQTVFAGLWWWWLGRRLRPVDGIPLKGGLRLATALPLALVWLLSIGLLLSGWKPSTYFALETVWALPPIIIQLIYGADILWRHRRLVALTILPLTIYLSLADSLAIGSGTWTIAPAQSFNIFIGTLPIEEILFFLFTNTLIGFGITLLLAPESRARAAELKPRLSWNWKSYFYPQS